MKNFITITTINKETQGVKKFKSFEKWEVILVGDKKTPFIKSDYDLKYLDLNEQKKLGFKIYSSLPYNHYVRKNIGYLFGIREGANLIYDTDDDNLPYENWAFPEFDGINLEIVNDRKYHNIYSDFSSQSVWPRGFPLDEINQNKSSSEYSFETKDIAVWQGLADLDPDVDAIHRLLFNSEIRFDKRSPIGLEKGVYCPFNSQNTLWHRDMIPYAYLPSTVTFRFTDILRGYIAQRCFWEYDRVLGFTQATVYQERNVHNLMKDFESEIPCYLQTKQVVEILDELALDKDYERNLTIIYRALQKANIVEVQELEILDAWLLDLKNIF